MTKRKRTFKLDRILTEYEENLKRGDAFFGEYQVGGNEFALFERIIGDSMTKHDRKRHPNALLYMGNSIIDIVRFNSFMGTYEVLKGNTEGWENIFLAWRYEAWSTAFRRNYYEHPQTDIYAWDPEWVNTILAPSLTFGDQVTADWFSRILISTWQPEFHSHGMFRGWDCYDYSPFVLKIAERWLGRELDVDRPFLKPMGHYGEVFEYWDQPELLTKALYWMCEEHLKETYYRSGYLLKFSGIQCYWPLEILFVERIRRDLGLETPRIYHSFLEDNPLYEMPEKIDRTSHEFADRIIIYLCSKFPKMKPFDYLWK